MRLLTIIPARGGSKGIPRKNIRSLAGKPLIAWTIEAAHKSRLVERVIVSTEDEDIAEVARTWGADVPFMRPKEFAQDSSSSLELVLHAFSELPEYDWMLLLQPTSPLRTAEDIDSFIEFCKLHAALSAMSVAPVGKHPHRMYKYNSNGRLIPFLDHGPRIPRRQDLPDVFASNGALYWAQRDWLKSQRDFIGPETFGYEMPIERSIELDNLLDWHFIEFLIEKNQLKSEWFL